MSPAHLLSGIQRIFGPDTVYTTDSGNGTFLAMECLRLEEAGKFLAPVDYSCMGYSVPETSPVPGGSASSCTWIVPFSHRVG